jgi:DHA1 family bicyclomycin/chloramphenicol resistance-like MFS transporter
MKMQMTPNSIVFTAVLGALSALPPLSIDMGLPGIPAIEASFAGAENHGALTLSLFLFGFAMSPVLCGPLSDRFGRRPTMLVGLALFSIAAAACCLVPTFSAVLTFRLLQGVAAGACVVMPFAIVRDLFNGIQAQTKLAQIMTVVGLAPLLAPILGGWVMAIGGWRVIYAVQASVGTLILLFVAIGFAESLPADRRRSLSPTALVSGYRMALSCRSFRNFTLIYSFGFSGMFAYISGSPAVLMGALGLTEQAFSLVFATTSCGMLFGSIVSARLGACKVPSNRILKTGLSLMAFSSVLTLALAITGHIHVLTIVPPVALTIFCFGLISSSAMNEALQPLPKVAGLASGIIGCVQMGMGSAASALIAALLPLGHPAIVMTALMAVCAATARVIFARQTRIKQ